MGLPLFCHRAIKAGMNSLFDGDFGTVGAVMISCEKRADERLRTLASFSEALDQPRAVLGDGLVVMQDDFLGPEVTRPQERQERVSLAAIEAGILAGWDYFLFLEDDVRFNRYIVHNLQEWEPLLDNVVHMASLYNPNVAGPNSPCPYVNAYIAHPRRVYGSQAFLLSRQFARHVARHWNEEIGMQDIKISRLASHLGPIFYHAPSLVQHAGTVSTWTDDARFHTAPDFSEDFRA